MKKIVIAGTLFLVAPFVSFAQTTTTATSQAPVAPAAVVSGFVPGDFFYFFDRWTEALNLALTFNNENKARKHLEYAKERVAEMSEVLKDPQATLADVASARDNFGEQVSLAATLVKEEKDKGNDVKNLARELDDELDASRDELKGILKEHKSETSRAEEEIRAKLAALAPNDPQVQGLTQALLSITKEKADADKEDGDIDTEIKDEQDLFEEVMGKELSTEKHLSEVLRLRNLVGQGLPEGSLMEGDKFMKNAEEAIKRGDFEKAQKLSEDAQRSIERVREAQDDTEEKVMEDGIDDSEVKNLEDEIKRGERMMEGLER
ncbi:MAG: DUF5667 domain-containing protein [Candidatus Pacebacteria bacterium]|jgi:hypothetical protein|nr:DUF5667 domain-containing protein [Candidatus Paceibacterota bacterium]